MPRSVAELSALITLLISLVFIYERFEPLLSRFSKHVRQWTMGGIFGVFAVINMMIPIVIADGVFFDARNLIVIIAGAFGGWRAGLLSAVIAAAYRLAIGGIGAPLAVCSISSAALLGIWFYRHYPDKIYSLRTLGAMIAVSILNLFLWLLLLPNGTGLDVVRQIALPAVLLYPLGILIIAVMLSRGQQQLTTQRKLEEGERRFRAMFNYSYQLAGLLSADGTVIEMNQTALTFAALKLEDVVGCPFWETPWWGNSPERQEQLRNAIQEAAAGKFVRYQMDIVGAGDKTTLIDFSIKPIMNDKRQVTLLICEGRDISYEMLAEHRKRELETERGRVRALEQFVNDTALDLRAPVAVIYTSTTVIGMALNRIRLILTQTTKDASVSPNARQSLKEIEDQVLKINHRLPTMDENVTRLKNTLTGLSEIVRLESEQQYQMRAAKLNDVVAKNVEKLKALAEEKHITLSFDPAPRQAEIMLDPVRFDLVVQNLIENALLYTVAGGTVAIKTQMQSREMLLEVIDTGRGIEPAILPNIFDRFYRSEQSRVERSTGTGLGLAIVKKIVEMHRGKIEVESTLGVGSTFRVWLPLQEQIPAAG